MKLKFMIVALAVLGLSPDCAVKDLWSKEREKKDKRSSGLG